MRLSFPSRKIRNTIEKLAVVLLVGVGFAVPSSNAIAQEKEKKFGDVVVRGYLKALETKTHQIKMSADRTYQITVKRNNESLNTVLRVHDETGMLLGQAEGLGSAVLEASPSKDGVYRLTVQSTTSKNDGPYTLTIKTEKGFRTLVYSGRLTANDGFDRVRRGCRFKQYDVRLQAGHTYIIDLEGNYDPYLRLEDSRGKNITQNDDGGVGLNSRITYRVSRTDKYRIIVTSCGAGRVGNYKLTVRKQGAGRTVFSTKAALTKKDVIDRIRPGRFHKSYAINLLAGRQYTIDLSSTQFNAYLRLENAAGQNLTINDNSGVGTNARISYRPSRAGIYRIIATSSGNGETGNFSLFVREQ